MGLSAIVYINSKNLRHRIDVSHTKVDEVTGETYFSDGRIPSPMNRGDFIAVEEELGNVAEIAALRDEILKCLGNQANLVNRVVYDGSHSGDIIDESLIDDVVSELRILESAADKRGSPELSTFVRKMNDLARASKQEHNPIVFV